MNDIQHLIILSGPSCSGKTTLINKIKSKKLPLICQQLDIKNPHLCVDLIAKDFLRMPESLPQNLILHYDICEHNLHPKEYDYLQLLMAKSRKVDIITLYITPKILQQRMRWRLVKKTCVLFLKIKKHRQILKYLKGNMNKYQLYYRQHNKLLDMYNDWFAFCQKFDEINHWCIEFKLNEYNIHLKKYK